VGWAISTVNDRHLTLAALTMALNRRCPETGLVHHSDRGATYASEDYQRRLDAYGITCSMSRTGDCYDNAVMEAFFSRLKIELTDRFDTLAHARHELFKYLEAFYNTRRRHSTMGYVSPAVFEERARSAGTNGR
jgi:transposase InsO family protein